MKKDLIRMSVSSAPEFPLGIAKVHKLAKWQKGENDAISYREDKRLQVR